MASDASRDTMAAVPAGLPPILDAYAYPGHADALEAALAETTRLAQSEPGCIHYGIARDDEDSTVSYVFERYRSRQAFEQHMQHPAAQKVLTYSRDTKAKCVKPLLPK